MSKALMGVQKFATTRNAQVETFVELVLTSLCDELIAEKSIQSYNVDSQKHFESEIASDIWDHYVKLNLSRSGNDIELWCQTTCYKGNSSGKPEPNKTYEVRETLVEAISLREIVADDHSKLRSIHFTVGPKEYSYPWFPIAKEATFDLSLYLSTEDGSDIFAHVGDLFRSASTTAQVRKNFDAVKEGELKRIVESTKKRLKKFLFPELLAKNKLADSQFLVIQKDLEYRAEEMVDVLSRAPGAGRDIKGQCNKLVHGMSSADPLIEGTVQLLLDKNPFLREARQTIEDWEGYSQELIENASCCTSIEELAFELWQSDLPGRLVSRRLLLRTLLGENTDYLQDLDIGGITEHNLYAGTHSDVQASDIVQKLLTVRVDWDSEILLQKMVSKESRALLRSLFWFEARNGTSLKPSFDYITLALESKGFTLKKATSAQLTGFHAEFEGNEKTVKPYQNFKLLLDHHGNELALLKGKFFRSQEFARRCKEEAYIALSLKYSMQNGAVVDRSGLPLIMFIDMEEEYDPPEYALKRLMAFGWVACFSVEDVLKVIGSDEPPESG